MHSSLLSWRDQFLKQLKDHSHNAKNIRSGKITNRIFDSYENSVRPHGCHKNPVEAEKDM